MGGHPGMGGMRGPKKEVNTTKYYELLGVEKSATFAQIKKAASFQIKEAAFFVYNIPNLE